MATGTEIKRDGKVELPCLAKTKTLIQKDTHITVHGSVIYSCQIWATSVSISGWMAKSCELCNGILLSHKDEILAFATTWMDLESIMASEITQAKKDKYCIIYVWTLKRTSEYNKTGTGSQI